MNKSLNIRLAKITDLVEIVDIYNQAIRSKYATADMDEFNWKDRREWFHQFDEEKFPIYVAETDKKVVGYCCISHYRKGRRALQSVAEISYYLDYDFLARGIGTSLMKHAIDDCKRIGINSLLAILLDINVPSIALLKKFNFTQWGYFPDIAVIDGKKCGQFIYGINLCQ